MFVGFTLSYLEKYTDNYNDNIVEKIMLIYALQNYIKKKQKSI